MEVYKNLDIHNLENEVWKVIEDFPDYSVSNIGRIKSFKRYKSGKILKQEEEKHGYLIIKINHKRLCIHRVVIESFNIINNNLYECNHIDGNKKNNLLENLEWITHSENIKKAYDLKLILPKKGELNGYTKLKNEEVWLIKKILNSDYYKSGKITQEFIGKMFKVNRKVISDIKTEKTWIHVK